MKPGVSRGIGMGFIGFVLGFLFIIVLRGLQSMDPLWDPATSTGLLFIVSAFTITGGFMWGMGAFDPRMSEHGEHIGYTEMAAREEQQEAVAGASFDLKSNRVALIFFGIANWVWEHFPRPHLQKPPFTSGFFLFNWLFHIIWFAIALVLWLVTTLVALPFLLLGILFDAIGSFFKIIGTFGGSMWRVGLALLIVLVVVFAFAAFPNGFFVKTVSNPGASPIENGIGEVEWPSLNGPAELGLGGGTIQINGEPAQISQLTLLAIFIAITLVSLLAVAGLIALVMYLLNRSITEAHAEPTEEDLVPPEIAQEFGGVFSWLARILRGIPALLGYK